MATQRYKLTCWNDEYEVTANLVEASAPIVVDGNPIPLQTADVRHRDNELRVKVAEYLYRDTPDHDADFDDVAELEPIADEEE